MADTGVDIRIRARGARQAASEVRSVRDQLQRLGTSGKVAAAGLTGIGRIGGTASRGVGLMANQARYAGVAIGGLGLVATKMGLDFNASMEQNRIAFGQFLGSTDAAQRELGVLYKLAKNTPFEFPQLTQGARKFLAFGFNVKQTNSLLRTVGDAAAGAGLGADAIDRIVLALGQIRSKGRLQSEELLQLQELGVIDTGDLRKRLGLTAAQMGDVGNQGISANKAIKAIQGSLNATFGGQAAKQAQTFSGQWSTLHDNINQTLGSITGPLFTKLRDDVFPALNKGAGEINDIFADKNLSGGEKTRRAKDVARRTMGPFVSEARRALARAHLGDRMGDAFEAAAPKMMDAAGRAAGRAATGFVHAFWHAGTWGKLFTLGLLGSKLGVFSALGSLAARRFLTRFGPAVAAGEAAAAGGGAAGAAGGLARFGPWGAAAAGTLGAGYFGTRAILKGLGVDDAVHNRQAAGNRARGEARMRAAGRVPVTLPNGATVWEKRTQAPPRARGATIHHTTIVKVRDREIGRANDRYNADQTARNRKRR